MRILIADDHALFRSGLSTSLGLISPQAVIIEASNFSQALKILDSEQKMDLIIVDLDMPDMHWEEGLQFLKNKAPDSRFVVVSASEDNRSIKKALEKGISGYIPKSADIKVLKAALNLIIDGGTYLPPSLLEDSLDNAYGDYKVKGKSKLLTPRQFEVLGHVAEGMSNKQIAYKMGVSEATVKLHINALLRAVGATNRTQAVIIAQKKGLI